MSTAHVAQSPTGTAGTAAGDDGTGALAWSSAGCGMGISYVNAELVFGMSSRLAEAGSRYGIELVSAQAAVDLVAYAAAESPDGFGLGVAGRSSLGDVVLGRSRL